MKKRFSHVLLLGLSRMVSACTSPSPGSREASEAGPQSADDTPNGIEQIERSVLRAVNHGTQAELMALGVSDDFFNGLSLHRRGPDNVLGSPDDELIDSREELRRIDGYTDSLWGTLEHGVEVDDEPLRRHDVSVLFPLSADLWRASDGGSRGPLLSRELFGRIRLPMFQEIEDSQEYDALRVVGLRFDPCFRAKRSSACQSQIRLVLQALHEGKMVDGAVHLLFNLSQQEWDIVLADLRALARSTPENDTLAPLGVSPALLRNANYPARLRELVLAHAGIENLARMTFMTRDAAPAVAQWKFGGFHLIANPNTDFPSPGPIVQLGGVDFQFFENQNFDHNTSMHSGASFAYGPLPADPQSHPLRAERAISLQSESALQNGFRWLREQTLASGFAPDETDCASCHAAFHIGDAMGRFDAKFAAVDAPANAGALDRDNIRHFGYWDTTPHVTPRVANETNAAVEHIIAR